MEYKVMVKAFRILGLCASKSSINSPIVVVHEEASNPRKKNWFIDIKQSQKRGVRNSS